MKRHSLFFALILCCLLSCKKDKNTETPTPQPQPVTPAVAENKLNLSYGSNGKQQYNIYLPANRTSTSTPILFLIHGGAWIGGDRSDFTNSIDGLRNMFPTYAFVTMSYRLYENGQNKFPTQEMDVKTCIESVLNKHTEFRVSQKFGIVGFSAGAHLALLYSYKYGTGNFQPKAVAEVSGPTDLLTCYTQASTEIKTLLSNIIGNPLTADSLLYISSSPTRFVTQNSTPTLIIHGDADLTVPYQQADILKAKLVEKNVSYDYKLYPNEGHALSQLASVDALLRLQTFFQARLN
jgi:acetyl esterase/lipase